MARVRVGWVDAARASAILLMVIFHFCYDLRYFGYVHWRVPNGPGWWQYRYVILTLFLGTVGISLSLAHGASIRWPAFWMRLLRIAAAALAVSLMSLYLFPQSWIYFGVLHFIAVASLLGVLLVRWPWIALGLGLGELALYGFGVLPPRWPFGLLAGHLPSYTEDFVPFSPWLGVVFCGIWIGARVNAGRLRMGNWQPPVWVRFAARHALAIYLLHQPLLFGLFFLAGKYA